MSNLGIVSGACPSLQLYYNIATEKFNSFLTFFVTFLNNFYINFWNNFYMYFYIYLFYKNLTEIINYFIIINVRYIY